MNVKQGQLVYLVRCLLPANMGKIGQVDSFIGTIFIDGQEHENGWLVSFPSGIETLLDGLGAPPIRLPFAKVPDAWLRPINDPDADLGEDTKLDKPIDCEVLT